MRLSTVCGSGFARAGIAVPDVVGYRLLSRVLTAPLGAGAPLGYAQY